MRSIGRSALRLCAGLLVVAGAVGCRRESARIEPPPSGFVAVVGVGQDDPLWPVLRASALRLHAQLGLSTVSLRVEAPRTSSVNAQKLLVQRLQNEGMTGLCVQVSEPRALAVTLDSLATKGVQVVTMMRPIRSEVPPSHCGRDQEAVGFAIAEALQEAIQGEGTVAVLHANSAGGVWLERYKAFRKRMEVHASVHVILEFDCRRDPDQARIIMRDTMRRYPHLGGWALMDNWPLRDCDAHGFESVGLPPTCRIVGVDPFPPVWDEISNGRVYAMVAAEYDRIAERALTACVAALMGAAATPASFSAPLRTVRTADLEAFKRDWRRWRSTVSRN